LAWIQAKGIVHAAKQTEDYFRRDFNMNLYQGCSHGCIYCDSRSDCYRLERFDQVKPKRDAVQIVERELRGKRRRGLIGTGAMSDPYNPLERELKLTRGALAAAAKYGFGVAVVTKSTLVLRDIDVLERILRAAPAVVHMTITAADDELCRKIEPYAPPSSERFAAVAELSPRGIHTGVLLTPLLPFLTATPDNARALAERAADCGARHAICYPGMSLRSGSREPYYAALERLWPGLSARYGRLYGDAYQCVAPDAREIYEAFAEVCDRRGLLHTVPEITAAIYAMSASEQIGLFP
jgi:DNA repair photolyase